MTNIGVFVLALGRHYYLVMVSNVVAVDNGCEEQVPEPTGSGCVVL